jgi:hypothetical protein
MFLGSCYPWPCWCWILVCTFFDCYWSADLRHSAYTKSQASASFFSSSLWSWTCASRWMCSGSFKRWGGPSPILVSFSLLACKIWSPPCALSQRSSSARIRSCWCCRGYGAIWAVIICFPRGHYTTCAAGSPWRSILWLLPLLACGVHLHCLRPHFGSSTPVEHGWCQTMPTCTFGCGEMLRDFIPYPPPTFDTNLLHSCCSCTTCFGCCSSQCRRPTLPSYCLCRVALATSIMSLCTIPDLAFVAKDTPASMLPTVCALVWLLRC